MIGSRVFGGSDEYTHVRALGNVFLSGALGLSVGRYLSDALNGYKLFRRDVFTGFEYTSRMFEIEIEIIERDAQRLPRRRGRQPRAGAGGRRNEVARSPSRNAVPDADHLGGHPGRETGRAARVFGRGGRGKGPIDQRARVAAG